MSRLTSKEVKSLAEAYQQVYAPQITEEQIWEEVEDWVNSLFEEGYDLSDYTWEEMYEAYIEEQGGNVRGQYMRGGVDPVKPVIDAASAVKQGLSTKSVRGRSGAARAASSSSGARPPMPGLPADYKRTELSATAAGQRVAGGKVGGGNAGASRQAPPAASTPAASRPAAPASRPAAAPAAGGAKAAPAGAAANPFTGAGAAAAKSAVSATTPRAGTQAAGPESIKPKTSNPLMKNMPGRNQAELDQIRGNAALSSISQSPSANKILSGTARSAQANQIGKASLERSAAAITAKPAPAAKPAAISTSTSTPAANPFKGPAATTAVKAATSPATPPKRTTQLFHTDLFDLVKGYLLDEGYADTEESALAIMSNMSEEWRDDIIEQQKSPEYEADRAKHMKLAYGIDINKPKPRPMGRQAAQRRIEQKKNAQTTQAAKPQPTSKPAFPDTSRQPKSRQYEIERRMILDREVNYRR